MIQGQGAIKTFAGNDSTTVFPFPYQYEDNDEVICTLVDSDGVDVPGFTYTVDAGNEGDPNGGDITVTSDPPATGTTLVAIRTTEPTQLVNYTEYDGFPKETHEAALDRITLMVQDLQEKVKYCVSLPVADQGDNPVGGTLPVWSSGSVLLWHATEKRFTASQFSLITLSEDVAQAKTDSEAAATAALASQVAAASSESAAATSETNAATSENTAYKWAEEAEDVEVVAGAYSAKHHATKSVASAALADDWANEAEDVEVNGGKYSAFHWAQKAADNSRSVTVHSYSTPSVVGQADYTPGFTMNVANPNVAVYLDGIRQAPTVDFTFTATVVTLIPAPTSDDLTVLILSQDVAAAAEAPAFADESGDVISLNTPVNYILDPFETKNLSKHLGGIDMALSRAPSFVNFFVNGDFRIHQRGNTATSVSVSTIVADMCEAKALFPGVITVAREDADAELLALLPGALYKMKLTVNDTSGMTYRALRLPVEGVASLSGERVTLSFAYRCSAGSDANYQILQDFGSGGSAERDVVSGTLNDDGAWHTLYNTFTMTSVVGQTIGSGASYIHFDVFTTQSDIQNATIELAECKLEQGEVASGIPRIPEWQALEHCQRYYQVFDASQRGPMWQGSTVNGETYFLEVVLPVAMSEFMTVPFTTVIDESGGTAAFNVATPGIYIQAGRNGVFEVECAAINTFTFGAFRLTDYICSAYGNN